MDTDPRTGDVAQELRGPLAIVVGEQYLHVEAAFVLETCGPEIVDDGMGSRIERSLAKAPDFSYARALQEKSVALRPFQEDREVVVSRAELTNERLFFERKGVGQVSVSQRETPGDSRRELEDSDCEPGAEDVDLRSGELLSQGPQQRCHHQGVPEGADANDEKAAGRAQGGNSESGRVNPGFSPFSKARK